MVNSSFNIIYDSFNYFSPVQVGYGDGTSQIVPTCSYFSISKFYNNGGFINVVINVQNLNLNRVIQVAGNNL